MDMPVKQQPLQGFWDWLGGAGVGGTGGKA
jgi:hypothetical protein